MIYKKYENNNYNLYTIKTDKFKGCQMQIVFKTKLEKENITEKNILIDVLMHTSKKYNKRKLFVEKLEDLYAANLYGINSRVGKTLFTTFILDFLDPKYCDKNYLEEVIKLPFEMIYNPNVNNNEFDKKTFDICKNKNLADIISFKENTKKYAYKQALKTMDEESLSSIDLIGYEKDLEKIDEESLYQTYQKFLKESKCDIFIIGNLDMDFVNTIINKLYPNKYIYDLEEQYFIENKIVKKVKDQEEIGDYAQSNLILLYNTVDFTKREMDYTIHIFNYIFGSGSLTTKLSKYLREENSLCYSTYSAYQKLDNLLMVYVGTDLDKKKQCIKLIDKALKEMIDGQFSEEDMDSAKKSLQSNLKFALDNESSLLDNYIFNVYIDTPFLKERINEIKTVSKDEVINLAKKIKLNTIFMLGGKNEKN